MLPYLTPDLPGIGGLLKQRPEDFQVEEVPLYDASGEGEHVYAEVQKVGMTTFEAIARLSSRLNVPSREIGYAGMKDAHAVTRQVFSISGTTPEAVMDLAVPGLTVRWAVRHGNKLRLGHLAGNRFEIKIRDVEPTDVVKLKPIFAVLEKRGMPNFFGEQRFGRRDNNDQLGAALIRGDHETLLKLLLGTPDKGLDDLKTQQARAAFDRRDNAESMKLWPRSGGMERRVLARLMKTHRPSAAVHAIDEKIRRIWVSAVQSRLFNDVLARRIAGVDRLLDGDLAYKHDNGACFHVESAAAEQPRCDGFEVSPTGPLVGYRMTMPAGDPLAVEQAAMAAVDLTPDVFKQSGKLRVKGARRPLRVQPKGLEMAAGVDAFGPHVTVAFTLPAGAFATVLVRELMKADEPAEVTDGEAEPEDVETAAAE